MHKNFLLIIKQVGVSFFTFFICLILCDSMYAQGNLPASDGLEYYYRVLQVAGIAEESSSFTLRPVIPKSTTWKVSDNHPWQFGGYEESERTNFLPFKIGQLNLYEPVWFQSYNSKLPRGSNDGAIWQGKGYNTAFSTGLKTSIGPLHFALRPQVGFSQNRSFDLGPYTPPTIVVRSEDYRGGASEYAYRDFLGNIDYVQRYGDTSYSWFDWGQSSLELRGWGLRAALSNMPIWTGPAVHTSLQFGYSAPGFRHLYLGTYRPISSPIGSFEFAYIFGATRKSDYFDADGEFRNRQSINSLFLTYSPRFIPGFSIGALRSFFHPYPANFSEYRSQASKLYEAAVRTGLGTPGSPDGGSPDNQVFSFFLRWIRPEAGIEIYTEYGRNDHNADLRDFRQQPNHHRAYTLGLIKTIGLSERRLLAVNVEFTQQEAMRSVLTRGNGHFGGWYTHGAQVFGLTNRGQIFGTGYGPGVNMQMVKADLFDPRGRLAFKMARIVYHNSRLDQFFNVIKEVNEDTYGESVERRELRNVELMTGVELTSFLQHGIELSASMEYSFIFNHHNLKENDTNNLRLELVLRKQIRGWLR